MQNRFVDVRPFKGTDDEYFLGPLVGSTTICRALGFGGPAARDAKLGRAEHLAALQPDIFEEQVAREPELEALKEQFTPRVAVLPEDCSKGAGAKARRAAKMEEFATLGLTAVTPKAYEAALKSDLREQWRDSVDGKIVLSPSAYEEVLQMRGAIMADDKARDALHKRGTVYEKSYQARDTVTGLLVRLRPDAWRPKRVYDLKTAKDPSYYAFMKSAEKNAYFVQAALYTDVLAALVGAQPVFSWVPVGKIAPHHVGLYGCPESWLELGRRFYDSGLKIIAAARRAEEPPRPWWTKRGKWFEEPPMYLDAAAKLHEAHAESVWEGGNR